MVTTSTYSSIISDFNARTQAVFRNASRNQIITLAAVVAGLPLLQHLRVDYRHWYDLGRGGPPHNIIGYMFVKLLTLFGNSDIHSPGVYDRLAASGADIEGRTFLDGGLPVRAGPRPIVSKWAAPVRQLSAMAPESLRPKQWSFMESFADANSNLLVARESSIEGGTHEHGAIHVLQDKADLGRSSARQGPTECYHVHPIDGSAHTIVSAADAKTILETGWGERHILSGAAGTGIPSTYIMVYAPRTEEELAIHEMIAKAAARYALQKDQKLN